MTIAQLAYFGTDLPHDLHSFMGSARCSIAADAPYVGSGFRKHLPM